jgi:hypothetical protein
MDDATKIFTAIFAGIVAIAIASVIVGKKSQAPQAIQAISGGVAQVVSAAVNPVSANYGYGNGASPTTGPSLPSIPGVSINNLTNFLGSSPL